MFVCVYIYIPEGRVPTVTLNLHGNTLRGNIDTHECALLSVARIVECRMYRSTAASIYDLIIKKSSLYINRHQNFGPKVLKMREFPYYTIDNGSVLA